MAGIMRRYVVSFLVLFVFLVGIPAASAGDSGSLVSKINSARSSAGKPRLTVYWDLTDDARAHAKKMMKQGKVFTNPSISSATSGWKALGQVVGVGPSVGPLFDAFMASSKHRNTILGGYNYVGVGVATGDDGKIWVSIIFMLGPDGLVESTTTTTRSPATTTTTTTKAPSSTATATTQAPSSTSSGGGGTRKASGPSPEETEGVVFVMREADLPVLDGNWVPPSLLRPTGLLR